MKYKLLYVYRNDWHIDLLFQLPCLYLWTDLMHTAHFTYRKMGNRKGRRYEILFMSTDMNIKSAGYGGAKRKNNISPRIR